MIKKYNKENFESLEGIHLIDFYADWCGPCKMLGQVLETLEDVDIIKINVDEEEELAKKYKIMSIPNMLIIKDGEIVKRMIGFRSKEEILEEIRKVK
ncbi:MAG: thioredoxin family protein [Bacilli bacterium]